MTYPTALNDALHRASRRGGGALIYVDVSRCGIAAVHEAVDRLRVEYELNEVFLLGDAQSDTLPDPDKHSVFVIWNAERLRDPGAVERLAFHGPALVVLLSTVSLPVAATARIVLPPLDAAGVQELALTQVGARIDASIALHIVRLTDGNPDRVAEVLAEVSPEHWRVPGPAVPVPRRWREDLETRLPDTSLTAVLRAVAVAGDPVPPGLVEFLVPGSQDTLDKAISLGLLRGNAQTGQRSVVFQRATDRAVVLSDAPVSVVRELHLLSADYFHREGRPLDALRQRLLGCGPDAQEPLHDLIGFAEQLSSEGRWQEAGIAFADAAASTTSDENSDWLRVRAIEAMIASGDLPRAKIHLSGVRHPSSRLDSVRGLLELYQGHRTQAQTLLTSAGESSPEDAVIAARNAMLALADWDPRGMIQWSARHRAHTGAGVPLGNVAFVERVAHAALQESPPPEDSSRDSSALHLQGRDLAEGWLNLTRDDPLAARERLERRRTTLGSEAFSVWQDAWLARTHLVLGDTAAAYRAAEAGLTRAEQFGFRYLVPLLLWTATQIAVSRGEFSLARSYLTQLPQDNDALAIQRIPATMCRIWFHSYSSNLPAALEQGRALEELSAHTDIGQPGFWPWEDLHATNLVRAGELDRAEELVSQAMSRAQASPNGVQSVIAKLTVPESLIQIARGDVKEGLAGFDRALGLLDNLPLPYYRARILLEYGQALRRQGLRKRADDKFIAASALFHSMSATAMVEITERERRIGGMGRRLVKADGLTPQEFEIAQLAAAKATNREIAQELMLSSKTVEYHLTNVYRKLHIKSRTNLPGALLAYERAEPQQ